MAGFYTCDFWNRVLPQAAHADSGIRHAVMALSSVHRLFEETGDADGVSDTFGMQQYQLAIRRHLEDLSLFQADGQGDGGVGGGEDGIAASLAKGKGKESLENYLASSMLFICIEMLQGHFISAISLTKVAVRLFYEHIVPGTWEDSFTSSPQSSWPLQIFEAMLSRMQAKAIGLVGRTAVGVVVPPKIKKVPNRYEIPIPAKFASIEEARDFYDDFIWAEVFSSHDPEIHGIQDDLRNPVVRERHARVMDAWSKAFNAMVGDKDPNRLSQRERNAIAVLQARRLQTRFAFEMAVRDELADCNPMLWDDYIGEFSDTLDRLEMVLRTQDSDRVPAPPSPLSCAELPQKPLRYLFTLDFGLVAPLYEATRLCRDPYVRRRAIRLLRAYPMREGMWDGLLAARAGEAQMELEEGMALQMLGEGKTSIESAAEIPRDARIITLLPDFKPGQRWARTFFSKLPAQSPTIDRPKEWHFEQIITW